MTTPSSTENLFAGVTGKTIAPTAPVVPVAAPVVEAEDDEAPAPKVTELDMLKSRARLMGMQFSNNISLETLKAKVQAKLDGETKTDEVEETSDEAEVSQSVSTVTAEQIAAAHAVLAAAGISPAAFPAKEEIKSTAPKVAAKSARTVMHEEQMKLIRVRITNMDPKKKDLPGEIFTFANRVIGAVRKFVPYGEATENGYHLPFCIYQQLKDREFLSIKTKKGNHGHLTMETSMVREFALEVLDPLTEVELARLAASQAAAAGQG